MKKKVNNNLKKNTNLFKFFDKLKSIFVKIDSIILAEKYKNSFKYKIFNWLIFISFALVTFFIVSNHELWRDEAQSFLMARDMSILELIKNASSEGHPILWHLFLKIFICLGLSYGDISIIPYILTLIAAYFIIWKFPTNFFTKILILCSFPILYFCSVLARSYSLILPIFIILCFLYNRRYDKQILYSIFIILLSNIHIIFTGFAGVLFLYELYEFIKEKKNNLIIIIGSIVGLLLFFIQMYSCNTSYFEFKVIYIIVAFLIYGYSNNFIIGSLLYILFIAYIYELYKTKEYNNFFIFILSNLILIFILGLSSLSSYLTQLYLFFLIFSYWNIKNKNNKIKRIIILLFLLQTTYTYQIAISDIKYELSDSKNAAIYINDNIPKGSNIYCTDTSSCESIIPYTNNYIFIDKYTNKEFTYVEWPDYYKYDRKKKISNNSNYEYIIAPRFINITNLTNYEVIYESPNTIEEYESYYILKRK